MRNITGISTHDLKELSYYYGDILQRTNEYRHVTDKYTNEKKRINNMLDSIEEEIERRKI